MLCITAVFTWYGVAVNNGGYSPSDIPLGRQAGLYYNQTYKFQGDILNSTKATTVTPSTSDPYTGGASLVSAGAQAVTLTLSSIGQMIDIITSAQTTLSYYGIPPYFFDYATMFISVLMGMIIFAAIYKWWI